MFRRFWIDLMWIMFWLVCAVFMIVCMLSLPWVIAALIPMAHFPDRS